MDHNHGKRGAELAIKLRGKFFEATDTEMDLLVDACIGHSDGYVEAPVSIQTCWDADRLDLGRVGIKPNPKYLCTDAVVELMIYHMPSKLPEPKLSHDFY